MGLWGADQSEKKPVANPETCSQEKKVLRGLVPGHPASLRGLDWTSREKPFYLDCSEKQCDFSLAQIHGSSVISQFCPINRGPHFSPTEPFLSFSPALNSGPTLSHMPSNPYMCHLELSHPDLKLSYILKPTHFCAVIKPACLAGLPHWALKARLVSCFAVIVVYNSVIHNRQKGGNSPAAHHLMNG